ncbi:MAG: cytochrome b/b6 domain-containing protein [Acidimicrobiales bacterium]
MAETTLPRSDALVRFDRGERVLHWLNATLFLTLLATGAALYVPAISEVVARRHLLRTIHVYAGLSLPFPVVLTFAARRWGAAFRADARRLNRWSLDDRRWVRSFGRDHRVRVGKFNAGQKLNAAFTLGAIPVMLATGSIMYWHDPFRLSWRTGATFVHDWLFIGLSLTVTGHILFAVNDGESLGSMVRGRVSSAWAKRHAPQWYDEETGG